MDELNTNGTMYHQEGALLELSIEWSCQYVTTFFGQFLFPALGDRSHHQSLRVRSVHVHGWS
jgi:hypothetical protein